MTLQTGGHDQCKYIFKLKLLRVQTNIFIPCSFTHIGHSRPFSYTAVIKKPTDVTFDTEEVKAVFPSQHEAQIQATASDS